MSELFRELADLPASKRKLFEFLLAREEQEGAFILPRLSTASPARLSFAQERLWFLFRLAPASAAYNVPAVLEFRGEVEPLRIERAFLEVVGRHEALRTVVEPTEAVPVQKVLPRESFALPVVDLTGLADEPRCLLAAELAAAEGRRSFDLERDMPVRGCLLRLATGRHHLLLTSHHFAIDGWSLSLLVGELVALVREAGTDGPGLLAEPAIQYGDFAEWQREGWDRGRYAGDLAYWQQRLSGMPEILELPGDRPRPETPDFAGGTIYFHLPADLSSAVRELARRLRCTPFVALLSTLKILLFRYTGKTDIAVGTAVSSRARPELEHAIGNFANDLVLRSRLTGRWSYREVVKGVHQTVAGAFTHQDAPFEAVVAQQNVTRSPSVHPLFQVLFVYFDQSPDDGLQDFEVELLPVDSASARLDLNLEMRWRKDCLHGTLEFASALFDGTTMGRLIGHLEILLRGVVSRPDAAIADLPTLTCQERHALLWELNDTRVERAPTERLHSSFVRCALEAPDRVAVILGGQHLTYRRLRREAGVLSARLTELGVGPETVVAVSTPRSAETVVALLAVLDAGAGYLPLDPDDPAERRRQIMERSGCRWLVTTDPGAEPEGDWTLLAPTGESEVVAASVSDAVDPQGLGMAYVIFTSGSTGRPKGVVGVHSAAANRIAWMQSAYRLGPEDRVLQKTALTFDVSIWEVFWPLGEGAALVLAPPGAQRDPEALCELIVDHRVSVIHFVPSMLAAFVDRADRLGLESLRLVVASGEALPAVLAARFDARLAAGLENLYGPTEAAIDVTAWSARPVDGASIPIGRPIHNVSIHLLDRGFQVSPIGVPAEIVIGGVALARGYLGDPATTAAHFVPDASPASSPGSRVYRTGDLARRLQGGEVEFLGRLDRQIKVRGFRVEPGEIEAALSSLPEVDEAAVTVHQDGTGPGRLVAYLTGGRQRFGAQGLRRRLVDMLPAHMVPSLVEWLEAMPRTPSGKIDRGALPEPSGKRSEQEASLIPPRSDLEDLVAGIWSEVLGLDGIGVGDNFFALGGDSIRALQAMASASERGVHYRLEDAFRYQTVAELAAGIEGGSGGEVVEVIGLKPFDLIPSAERSGFDTRIEDAFPLTALQEGMLFHAERAPGSGLFHNVDRFRLRGVVRPALVYRAAGRLAQRHPALRTSFVLTGFTEPLQAVHRRATNPLRIMDLTQLKEEDREAVLQGAASSDERHGFDLGRPPLIRLRLSLLEPDLVELAVTQHHAVLDGWSLNRLLADLFEDVRLLAAEARPARAQPPPVSQRTAVALERKSLESEASRHFWSRELEGARATALPATTTGPGPVGSGLLREELTEQLTEDLRRFARESSVPLKSVFLAAFCRAVAWLSGEEDVLIGLITDVRPEKAGADRALGLFLNTLPLRLRVRRGSWRDLALATFEGERRAVPHRRFPLARVAQELGSELRPDLVFNFIHFHVVRGARKFGGLKLEGGGSFLRSEEALGLTVEVDPVAPERVHLVVQFDPQRVSPLLADRLKAMLVRILSTLVSGPDTSFADAPGFLGEGERHQLVTEWSQTSPARRSVSTVDRMVAAAAAAHPEAVALYDGPRTLSFRRLVARSERIARALADRKVGLESRVGLVIERSLEMAVAVLGILRSGAAFVPIDRSLPERRRRWLARGADLDLVLEVDPTPCALPPGPEGVAESVLLSELEAESGSATPQGAFAESTAYVLFTSGSTGEPKKVVVSARALAQHCRAIGEEYGLSPADRVLQAASLSFDVALEELLASWCSGAAVVLAPAGGFPSFQDLDRLVAEARLTVLNLPSSYWAGWIEEEARRGRSLPSTLRRVVIGSEAAPAAALASWRRVGGENVALSNAYGATETTVGPLVWHLPAELRGNPEVLPVGRPVPGARVYLCGRHNLTLVPVGAVGEVLIGGTCVARGYDGRVAETAERFLPDPFAVEPGARVYRTGDLGRWREGGQLELLGRCDDQVQIRGVRVEPEEVRRHILADERIREAVVVAHTDRGAGSYLMAFYVPVAGHEIGSNELRAFLARRLPSSMVPTAFHPLEELPRTSGGKIDVRALPAGGLGRRDQTAFVPPRGPAEEALAGLWRDLLEVNEVGATDSFFTLGGHSLLATRLLFRLRETFDTDLPMAEIYEHPTVRELAARISVHRQSGGAGTWELPVLEPDPKRADEPFPLTDVQQAYWIGREDAFELGNVAAHGYQELDLDDLDLERLEEALNRLIARHGMLRAIVLQDGRQRILPEVPRYRIEMGDARSDGAGELLDDIRREMSHQVMDPESWPLFELRATRLEGGRTRLHLGTDALIADAWSLTVLLTELLELYADPDVQLEPFSITFRDYVVAERALEGSEPFRRSREYWQERLPGLAQAPDLPRRQRVSSSQALRFGRREGQLDRDRWGRVKQLATRTGLTPSAVLLAAFAEVLGTWSKKPRFTLNLTLFNRLPLHPEVDRLIGDFTSLTLLEVNVARDASFADRARRLQARLWTDLDHRFYGGVRVLRDLARLSGEVGGAVMPVVFTSALGLPTLPGPDEGPLALEEGYGITQTPQVWLDHQVSEHRGALYFNWDSVEGLFPEGLLDAMFTAYRRTLERLAEDRSAWKATTLPMLSASTVAMHREYNETEARLPVGTLGSLFVRQVEMRPDGRAVLAPGVQLTYGGLDRLVRDLASRLLARGVGLGERVAVVLKKGWEQAAAVLAITRIGAAYLPIDPELPDARVQFLLEHGGVRVAVTATTAAERLRLQKAVEVVSSNPRAAHEEEAPAIKESGRPQDLAYVIFTSGSTGVPKGVMITHGAAVNTILDVNRRFGVDESSRVLALSSLSFDLSVWDIFGILAAGGTIVYPEAARARDPAHWAEVALTAGVTVWNSVPALMDLFVEYVAGQPALRPSGLKTVLMSGDWIPVSLPGRIRALSEQIEPISLGGATEASIWSIFFRIGEVDPTWSSIPYGRPLANQRFFVLDQDLEPRPEWVPGQLFIGGDGLALGYWRQPQVTAKAFVAHPVTGERLYRTGDLGRYLPGGIIEFLGREDFQVKVHGYRVELGEIEASLTALDAVAKAVVAWRPAEGGKGRLVGYFVPSQADAVSAEELRVELRQRLPQYMVPAVLIELPELPLTSNGKVDRRALPESEATQDKSPLSQPPETSLEKGLARIWCQVLGISSVSLDDEFFELGGNSLVAIRMIARLQETFGVRVPLVDFMADPTLRGLAMQLARRGAGTATAPADVGAVRIEADPSTRYEPFPLTDLQQAYWVGRQAAVELGGVSPHSYTEIEVVDLDLDRLERSVRRLVDRHGMLRAIVDRDGRQRVLPEVPPYEIEVIDLTRGSRREAEERLLAVRREMSHRVRPSETWPLFEVRASLLGRQRVRLHVGIDLLIADAWSIQIILGELGRLYGSGAEPPPLELSFRDYVLAEEALRDSEPFRQARSYWLDRLDRLPSAPSLPLVCRPGSLRRPRFVRSSAELQPDIWNGLKERASAAGLTPSVALLAAFAEVLKRWSRSPHFTLNLTTFNRKPVHRDVDHLVGDFTSTTLVEFNDAGSSFVTRSQGLQRQVWSDLDHSMFSGVQVLRALGRRRGAAHRAAMPVVFTSTLMEGVEQAGEERSSSGGPPWQAEVAFGVSQTPQVLLDCQIGEAEGVLQYNWDFVEQAYPEGLVGEMFQAYSSLLEALGSNDAAWKERDR